VAATNRLLRPAFGMFRIEWRTTRRRVPPEPRRVDPAAQGSGFEVEDLVEVYPPDGATTRYEFVTLEWARQWPCEEVWKACRRGERGGRSDTGPGGRSLDECSGDGAPQPSPSAGGGRIGSGAHRDAALRCPDEGEELGDFGHGTQLLLDPRHGGLQILADPEEHAERGPDGADAGGVEARAPHADAIDAVHLVSVVHEGEGRHVAAGTRQPAHDGEASDAHELVHHAVAGDEGALAQVHVPASSAPLATMTWFSMRQLWATCAFDMRKTSEPTSCRCRAGCRDVPRCPRAARCGRPRARRGRATVAQVLRLVATCTPGRARSPREHRVADHGDVREQPGARSDAQGPSITT